MGSADQELSQGIQESLLCLLCFDDGPTGAKAVRALVEAKSFDPFYREVAEKAEQYLDKYKKPPGEHTYDIIEQLKSKKPDLKDGFDRLFSSIQQTKDVVNNEYVLAHATRFAKFQRMRAGLTKALDALESDRDTNVDEAEQALTACLKGTHDLFKPGLLMNDVQQALSFLHQEDEYFETGIPELDRYNLGPMRGGLHLFMALPNRGKSHWGVMLGRESLKRRRTVLHISLEMAEHKVAQRYVQSFLAVSKRSERIKRATFNQDESGKFIDFSELDIGVRPSLQDKDIEKTLRMKVGRVFKSRPKLLIKQFPTGQLTMAQLTAYLDNLEGSMGFIPDLCLAEGSLVLTDRGEVPIDQVTLADKVWDGVAWVQHEGLVCKGVKDVITYCGLTATPNHKVYTSLGWRSLISCARLGLPIAKTGSGGTPLRLDSHYFFMDARSGRAVSQREEKLCPLCSRKMHAMRIQEMDDTGQRQARHSGRLRGLLTAQALSQMALAAVGGSPAEVSKPQSNGVERLWGAGHRVPISQRERGCFMGAKAFAAGRQSQIAARSDRQRRALRAGQLEAIHSYSKRQSYEKEEQADTEGSSISATLSFCALCGVNPLPLPLQARHDAQTGDAAMETQSRKVQVYDLLNAGPLHRFTVQGLLAHNCILDYADLMKTKAEHRREAIGVIYQELRGLAVERNIALVTMTQSNRAGLTSKTLNEGNASEDFSKVHTADTIIAYSQTDEEYALGLARLVVTKARDDQARARILIAQQYSICQFCLESARLKGEASYWKSVETEDEADD